MSGEKLYAVPGSLASSAHINNKKYLTMYARSIEDPDNFWAEQAEVFVTWYKKWNKVVEWDVTDANIQWFKGAKLNVSYNCLDRHLDGRGDQTAIIWEGDDPAVDKKITYRQLHESRMPSSS